MQGVEGVHVIKRAGENANDAAMLTIISSKRFLMFLFFAKCKIAFKMINVL